MKEKKASQKKNHQKPIGQTKGTSETHRQKKIPLGKKTNQKSFCGVGAVRGRHRKIKITVKVKVRKKKPIGRVGGERGGSVWDTWRGWGMEAAPKKKKGSAQRCVAIPAWVSRDT